MKRHLKTHGRRRAGSAKGSIQLSHGYSPTENDLVITKVEDNENSEGVSDGSNAGKKEDEAAVSSLQFDQDPLDTTRGGNTL